ncbi:MAG TPA: PTS sugar transporter subunit IIA [Candidatus Hydrogenedentes bacterium]|jgi:mannitol/fructose-specific phosphotransferase system IIA component (Ntr-type)|nr:MAG: PTS system fructose-specific EIIABC component [Candidatus Hydrogenedentes bacterium ADurb.Bin170]HNZ49125.1 PTS sugar transporter subunit IIA [Candidatus Hydrogenedentota bacterium]
MITRLEFIEASQIRIIPAGATKHEALEILVEALCQNPAIQNKEVFTRAVHEREAIQTTGLGNGVAVPHVRIDEVSAPTVALGIAPDGLDFQALDNRPVYIIVLFATPQDSGKTYLSLLAKVMVTLREEETFAALAACRTVEEVTSLLGIS